MAGAVRVWVLAIGGDTTNFYTSVGLSSWVHPITGLGCVAEPAGIFYVAHCAHCALGGTLFPLQTRLFSGPPLLFSLVSSLASRFPFFPSLFS